MKDVQLSELSPEELMEFVASWQTGHAEAGGK
jgi:hypothetical protein